MKIIHCADIHLNFKMAANLTKETAKERKAELLHTLIHRVDYAVREEVQAVIIAGDLFDHNQINKTTRNAVYDQIKLHPWIEFYYLQGNHDSNSFLSDMEEIPENLKLFGKEWTTYIAGEGGTTMKDKASGSEPQQSCNMEGSVRGVSQNAVRKVAITGVELDQDNSSSVYHSLVLDAGCFNIVVMHGQESEQSGKDKTEIIALRELRNV